MSCRLLVASTRDYLFGSDLLRDLSFISMTEYMRLRRHLMTDKHITVIHHRGAHLVTLKVLLSSICSLSVRLVIVSPGDSRGLGPG